jgi:hypothetical protein
MPAPLAKGKCPCVPPSLPLWGLCPLTFPLLSPLVLPLHLLAPLLLLTMVAHAGLIVLAVVVVAAGAAAYENPQIREWLENSRRKIALALHSLGDEISPRVKQSRRNDPSMQEDETEAAEERRRRAREEIMEKGRIMEERQRRKRSSKDVPSPTGSFDTLVDKDGMLKMADKIHETHATTTAMEPEMPNKGLTNRRPASPKPNTLHESVDAPMLLRQLSPSPALHSDDPFVTEYEREMRNTWNLPLPHPAPPASSAHESESLIEFTPTSEYPDPDIIIPGGTASNAHSMEQTDYFSLASNSSYTLSEEQPGSPPVVLPHTFPSQPGLDASAISTADSIDHVYGSDVEGSVIDGGVLSEFGDGIRTPASGWTDVGSVVSSDSGH